jgi:MerR family redox-sensitive transcriptional activator SoxR
MESRDLLTIGEAADRAGVAASTLRFYEAEGLVEAERTAGNQRRFRRAELRRIALIRVAQSFGLTLDEIREALESLPDRRTPTRRDWERLARRWSRLLDERIATLQRLRDEASSCIGCGCLSLQSCKLYNAGDRAARFGQGPRYLLGDDRGKTYEPD